MNQPVIFGEVLFDCFPDESTVLGGAPFNVAWHLQGFGKAPILVSRVGQDRRGQQVLQTMQQWGMTTDGVQTDDDRPTGTVQVSLDHGQPRFDIVDYVAYDGIDSAAALQVLHNSSSPLLYHGTLAIRHDTSRACLETLRRQGWPCFIDLNLRPPWWNNETIEYVLQQAQWIKLNDHELAELAGCQADDKAALTNAAREWQQRYALAALIVTRGEHGAMLVDARGCYNGEPVHVENLIDTVGAGDAFSAIVILGLLNGWSVERILPRALQFASLICSNRGATTTDRSLYTSCLEKWDQEGD